MAVDTSTRKIDYTMGIAITEYVFPFRALVSSPEDIKCVRQNIATGVTEDMTYVEEAPEEPVETDVLEYTVEVNDNGVGGVVRPVWPSSNEYKIFIYSHIHPKHG